MARIARVVVPDVAHHVTQRGNRRERVFFTGADRERFLELLHDYSVDHGLETLGYCVLGNHLHLVVVPEREDSLARVLKPVNLRYAQYINRRKGWCGRVWQERFYSCPMDERHCLIAVRYVEQNPVRAGLARMAEEYRWSSAAGHSGMRVDRLLADRRGYLSGIGDWSAWLKAGADRESGERLGLYTRTGRPLGEAGFVERIETLTGRELRPKPHGRPRKTR
ncbi:MAG: transposase [candidate division WOR-3 bacterium]|nr:MAG: transposase [candidate division WOR-3 bacterium]